jgi:PPOX class probable FMN-dependent enzyme
MAVPWLDAFRSVAARPLILSLATVAGNGGPDVRSVICRRVEDDGSLWFTSDARSGKDAQLAMNSNVAAVYWAPATREQFRFWGGSEILNESSGNPSREELWKELTAETRAMFFWPPPGEPRVTDSRFVAASEAESPPATFDAIVLRPSRVEHLALSMHPHRRTRWTFSTHWTTEDLNP